MLPIIFLLFKYILIIFFPLRKVFSDPLPTTQFHVIFSLRKGNIKVKANKPLTQKYQNKPEKAYQKAGSLCWATNLLYGACP